MKSLLNLNKQIALQRVMLKEYILVRERTAPPCVYQTCAHPTSIPACSVKQSGSWSKLQTELGEVGWANVWKTQGGAVRSLTKIYSLDAAAGYFGTLCSVSHHWRSCRDYLQHSWPSGLDRPTELVPARPDQAGPKEPVPARLDLDRSGPLPPVPVMCR